MMWPHITGNISSYHYTAEPEPVWDVSYSSPEEINGSLSTWECHHWCPAFLASHHPSAVPMETEPALPQTVSEFQRPPAAEGFDISRAGADAPTKTDPHMWLIFPQNRNDTLFSACPDAHRQITLVGLGEGERGSCGVSFKGLYSNDCQREVKVAQQTEDDIKNWCSARGGRQRLSHACQALRRALNKSSGRAVTGKSSPFYCAIYFLCWKSTCRWKTGSASKLININTVNYMFQTQYVKDFALVVSSPAHYQFYEVTWFHFWGSTRKWIDCP